MGPRKESAEDKKAREKLDRAQAESDTAYKRMADKLAKKIGENKKGK